MGAWPIKYTRMYFLYFYPVVMVAGVALAAGLNALGGPGVARAMGVLLPLAALALVVGGLYAAMPRDGRLRLEGAQLVVERGASVQRVDLGGARVTLARWTQPPVGVVGTVVLVDGPGGKVCVGGRDRVMVPGGADAPSVTRCELYLDAASFDAFVAALGARVAQVVGVAHGEIVVELAPSTIRGVAVAKMMALYMLVVMPTIALLAFAVQAVLPGGAGGAVTTVLALALIVGFVVSWQRRKPWRVRFAAGRVRLVDAAGATVEDLAVDALHRAPGIYTMRVKGSAYRMPVVALAFPSGRRVRVGVHDVRYGWGVPAGDMGAGEYLVGPAEWRPLLRGLGVEAHAVEDPHVEGALRKAHGA